jgi:chromate reductase
MLKEAARSGFGAYRNSMTKRLLVVNGSIRGRIGNTGEVLAAAAKYLPEGTEPRELVLATYEAAVEDIANELRAADGLLVGTGVYWGSWGSPLQRFLEVMTTFEASSLFVGKPVGVVVTMDSVGGSDVAQRLLGVFSTLGCLVPPMPMVVVSRVAACLNGVPGNEDVWQVEDLSPLLQNLVLAMTAAGLPWRTWPVVKTAAVTGRYPANGVLDLGVPRFPPRG